MHLVCTAVVNGLNNFQVGMPSVLPTEGTSVDTESYVVCGTWNNVVSIHLVISVDCAPSTEKFRYVIVQSLDTEAEKLCLAEVAVYIGGTCAAALTTHALCKLECNYHVSSYFTCQ